MIIVIAVTTVLGIAITRIALKIMIDYDLTTQNKQTPITHADNGSGVSWVYVGLSGKSLNAKIS